MLRTNQLRKQATIPLETSSHNNVVRVVGVKNMGDCMRFLSRVCNVDMDKPAFVYMVTLVGRLPHHPKMRMDVSLLHHVLASMIPSTSSFLDYTCEMDMEDHGITLEVKDWSKLESFVNELTTLPAAREDATKDYVMAMAALDPISRRNVLKASTKINVTSKQPVTMKFMWAKNQRAAANEGAVEHVEWTSDVQAAVKAMCVLVMRFLEISS